MSMHVYVYMCVLCAHVCMYLCVHVSMCRICVVCVVCVFYVYVNAYFSNYTISLPNTGAMENWGLVTYR